MVEENNVDSHGFDTLTKACTSIVSRRTALAGFVGVALALAGHGETLGHDPSGRCKNIPDRQKRNKCTADAKKHKKEHQQKARAREMQTATVYVTGAATCGHSLFGCQTVELVGDTYYDVRNPPGGPVGLGAGGTFRFDNVPHSKTYTLKSNRPSA
jgi:hypothetical protein